MKNRRIIRGGLAVVASAGLLATAMAGVSSGQETELTSLVATHPEASVETTANARTLHDLAVVDGELVAGYGDWNANTGPVTINSLDLDTMTWSGSQLEVPTEALQNVRILEGGQYDGVYWPLTDPRTSQWADSGFVKDSSSGWELHEVAPAIHVFDVAQLAGELWMVGSAWDTSTGTAHGAATAYRTTDGENWELMRSEFSADDGRNFERYYWAVELDGKIYMQAEHINSPVRFWDGKKWGSKAVKVTGWRAADNPGSICGSGNAKEVISFGGNILCPWNDGTMVFDGKKGNKAKGWPFDRTVYNDNGSYYPERVEDWFVDGEYLYGLSNRGSVARSLDGLSWQVLLEGDERVPAVTTSLAVYNDHIYLGSTEGQILVVNEPVSSLAEGVPVESPPNGKGNGKGNGNGGGNNGGGNNGNGPGSNNGNGKGNNG